MYTGEYLRETSADDWVAIDRAAKESNQGYSFETFREMLQNKLLLKAQQESKLFACLKALSQRPTQFVENFLAYFTIIK